MKTADFAADSKTVEKNCGILQITLIAELGTDKRKSERQLIHSNQQLTIDNRHLQSRVST
jgi:hypothetical protein